MRFLHASRGVCAGLDLSMRCSSSETSGMRRSLRRNRSIRKIVKLCSTA